jgi:hypothetical protein
MGISAKSARVRLLAVPIAFLALQQLARADMYTADFFFDVGIYYGSVELFSPGGTLLSTTYAMTMETTNGCQLLVAPLADQQACATATGNSVVEGLATQTTPAPPPVFSQYFQSQLPSFEDINGLGNAAPASIPAGFDPTNTPTPTSEALYADLTSQPGSFAVTGDTGFVAYGNPFDYVFAWDITFPVPFDTLANPPCCVTDGVATLNVQFFERDVQLTEIATPEPSSWLLLATAAGLLLAASRRNSLPG